MKSLRMISYVILALGVLVFIVGLLFKIQHWPDIFNGLTKGLALIITGTVFFLISLASGLFHHDKTTFDHLSGLGTVKTVLP